MNRRVVVAFDESESLESLEWLLQGSGFNVLSARQMAQPSQPAGDRAGLGPEHCARELIHRVAMLTYGLQLPNATDGERRRWPAAIADANRRLDALYAAGLSRDFGGEPTRSHRPPVGGNA
jgi:hypothetical protein